MGATFTHGGSTDSCELRYLVLVATCTGAETLGRNKSVVINICKVYRGVKPRALRAPELWKRGERCRRASAPPRPRPRPPSPRGRGLHRTHVVLRQQRDFQDLGVGEDGLVAGGGDGLAGDPVHLVEGVGPQQPVVRCPDEQLQGERLALHVAVQLGREGDRPVSAAPTPGPTVLPAQRLMQRGACAGRGWFPPAPPAPRAPKSGASAPQSVLNTRLPTLGHTHTDVQCTPARVYLHPRSTRAPCPRQRRGPAGGADGKQSRSLRATASSLGHPSAHARATQQLVGPHPKLGPCQALRTSLP